MVALSARDQIMQADRVADVVVEDIMADFDDLARDFVSECEGKRVDARTPGPIMHIGMTNAGGANAHKDVTGTATRHRDVGIFNGVTGGRKADSAHKKA